MKVGVVSHSPVPFRHGGAERLFAGLTRALDEAGHTADLIKLPAREMTLPDLVESYRDFAQLDLSHFDMVITGRYPAWMVDHPHHVVWMLHPLRGLYDSYPSGRFVDTRLPDTAAIRTLVDLLDRPPLDLDPDELIDATLDLAHQVGRTDELLAIPGPLARSVVHHLDRIALDRRRVRRHAAISATVAGRADYFPPDVEPVVLHPPVVLPWDEPTPVGDLVVAASRLDRPKRLDMVISAFRRVEGDVKLVIAGEGPEEERLRRLASGDPRIEVVGRVGDPELRDLYRRARAVVFCPRDEDYGYIAPEAMAHARPVVTTVDAGGPTELIVDGVNGLVAEPDAPSVAAAIGRLVGDEALARRLGLEARRSVEDLRWDRVVEVLSAPRRPRRRKRPRLVAVSTYPLHPQLGGGQLRGRHLLAALCADDAMTAEVVSVSTGPGPVTRHRLAPRVTETVVPLSRRHIDAETELRLVTGPVSLTDVAAGLMWQATPALVRELAVALEEASAVQYVQPYLAPAVLELTDGMPTICDEHNHERALKSGMYPSNEGGAWLLGKVLDIERLAVRSSALVTTTTDADRAAIISEYRVDPHRTAVIPNGVDTDAIPFVTGEERRRRRAALIGRLGLHPSTAALALFVGSGHAPNIDAGRSLIHIAPTLPHVDFLLAGRHSDELHRSNLPPNVHLLGTVPEDELELLLGAADMALNPITTGGGSNLKLLTYLAAGLPVITSAVGARGIDAANAGVVVAGLERLGDAIERVAGSLGEERAIAGREYVVTHADWRMIGAHFADLVYEHVLVGP